MDGNEVKQIRLTLGLTQEEFAHQLGVSHGTVSRWENRKNIPSRLAIIRFQEMVKKSKKRHK